MGILNDKRLLHKVASSDVSDFCLPKIPGKKCKKELTTEDRKRCGLHNLIRIDIVVVLERLYGFFEQVHYHAPHVPFDKKLPKENKQQFAKQILSSQAKKILRTMPG